MGAVLHRLLQTLRFERDAFVWMDLNDRATGDGLLLVVVTQILLLLGNGQSLLGLALGFNQVIGSLLSAIVFWLVYSGITYAASRYLFSGHLGYATVLRIAGFAYPTLLLWLFTTRVLPSSGLAAFILGAVWLLAIVAYGVHYVADLPLEKAAASAILGLVGWVIVAAIFSGGIIF